MPFGRSRDDARRRVSSVLFLILGTVNSTTTFPQILDYWWEGDDLVGIVEVLPTAKGETLKAYFLVGRKLGVSSRGWATLQDSGDGTGIYIQDDFELITCACWQPRA